MRNLLEGEGASAMPLDEAAWAGAEKREAPRVGVLIRAAKLLTPVGEYLCVIRDVSETGVSARIFHELPDCGEMLFELQNGDRYAARLIWQDGERAGFRFADRADLARLVASPSRFAKRQIRLNVEGPAIVQTAGTEISVTLLDLSGQGAKIECASMLPIDAGIVLSAQGLAETWAKVRWRRDGRYGLVFEDTLQFSELASTVHQMQTGLRSNT